MIRYIDLKDQRCEDYPEFAWFDTVRDEFIEFNGSQTWRCWDDFERDFKGTDGWSNLSGYSWSTELERFRGLFPKKGKKK